MDQPEVVLVNNPDVANEEIFEIMEVDETCPEEIEAQAETSSPVVLEEEGDFEPDYTTDPLRRLQFKLSKRKKEIVKVKSRMKSCQLRLEEQDEQLKSLQEQIAKRRATSKKKVFDWAPIRSAHLISKVFEFCEPVKKVNQSEQNNESEQGKTDNEKPKDNEEKEEIAKSKCLYTADFHRFAIALYFFSPKSYFFLSNIAPMFPHRNYIRQWVTSGRVEKLFPQGVYREEFNDVQ